MTSKRFVMMMATTLALALVGCSSRPAPKPALVPVATQSASAPISRSDGGAATASGEIVPAALRNASLSFPAVGRVQKVNVAVGDSVQAGDVLMAQDTARLEAELARARGGLDVAQAQLAQLKAGAQAAQITAAEQSVQEAEAAVMGASAQLAQLQAGARAAEIATAEAEVARLAGELDRAQKAYNGVLAGRATAKEYGVPGGGLGQYEEQMRAQLSAVRASYEAAQKRLEQVKAGPTKSESDAARARLAGAQAQKARTQAQLELLKAGATKEQIAAVQANVAQAQAMLDLAQIALEQAKLRAPFAGMVVAVEVNPGEMASPGQVAVTLADLSHLQVETTDLSEKDVSRIAVGNQVVVHVKALGKEIKGKVAWISPRATKVGGDVVYKVVIDLDDQPEGLRWGMSVDVEIMSK